MVTGAKPAMSGTVLAGEPGYSVLQEFRPVFRAIQLDAFCFAQRGRARRAHSFERLIVAGLNAGGVEQGAENVATVRTHETYR